MWPPYFNMFDKVCIGICIIATILLTFEVAGCFLDKECEKDHKRAAAIIWLGVMAMFIITFWR